MKRQLPAKLGALNFDHTAYQTEREGKELNVLLRREDCQNKHLSVNYSNLNNHNHLNHLTNVYILIDNFC